MILSVHDFLAEVMVWSITISDDGSGDYDNDDDGNDYLVLYSLITFNDNQDHDI